MDEKACSEDIETHTRAATKENEPDRPLTYDGGSCGGINQAHICKLAEMKIGGYFTLTPALGILTRNARLLSEQRKRSISSCSSAHCASFTVSRSLDSACTTQKNQPHYSAATSAQRLTDPPKEAESAIYQVKMLEKCPPISQDDVIASETVMGNIIYSNFSSSNTPWDSLQTLPSPEECTTDQSFSLDHLAPTCSRPAKLSQGVTSVCKRGTPRAIEEADLRQRATLLVTGLPPMKCTIACTNSSNECPSREATSLPSFKQGDSCHIRGRNPYYRKTRMSSSQLRKRTAEKYLSAEPEMSPKSSAQFLQETELVQCNETCDTHTTPRVRRKRDSRRQGMLLPHSREGKGTRRSDYVHTCNNISDGCRGKKESTRPEEGPSCRREVTATLQVSTSPGVFVLREVSCGSVLAREMAACEEPLGARACSKCYGDQDTSRTKSHAEKAKHSGRHGTKKSPREEKQGRTRRQPTDGEATSATFGWKTRRLSPQNSVKIIPVAGDNTYTTTRLSSPKRSASGEACLSEQDIESIECLSVNDAAAAARTRVSSAQSLKVRYQWESSTCGASVHNNMYSVPLPDCAGNRPVVHLPAPASNKINPRTDFIGHTRIRASKPMKAGMSVYSRKESVDRQVVSNTESCVFYSPPESVSSHARDTRKKVKNMRSSLMGQDVVFRPEDCPWSAMDNMRPRSDEESPGRSFAEACQSSDSVDEAADFLRPRGFVVRRGKTAESYTPRGASPGSYQHHQGFYREEPPQEKVRVAEKQRDYTKAGVKMGDRCRREKYPHILSEAPSGLRLQEDCYMFGSDKTRWMKERSTSSSCGSAGTTMSTSLLGRETNPSVHNDRSLQCPFCQKSLPTDFEKAARSVRKGQNISREHERYSGSYQEEHDIPTTDFEKAARRVRKGQNISGEHERYSESYEKNKAEPNLKGLSSGAVPCRSPATEGVCSRQSGSSRQVRLLATRMSSCPPSTPDVRLSNGASQIRMSLRTVSLCEEGENATTQQPSLQLVHQDQERRKRGFACPGDKCRRHCEAKKDSSRNVPSKSGWENGQFRSVFERLYSLRHRKET